MNKVGIVMANYKMKPIWIRQAILSVLAQTVPDWHLYIVGVEGDETTTDMVKETAPEERITYQYLPKGNVYEQRNVGMKQAVEECKYVTFLDSDDYLLPYKLLVELMRAEMDGFDLVYSSYYYCSDELVIFKYAGLPTPPSKMAMLGGCVIPDYALLSTAFAKEHLFVTEQDGWTGYLNWPRYKTGCVYDTWLRAIGADARVGLIAAPTWFYRQREGSLGKQLHNAELMDRKEAIDAAKLRWGIRTPTNIEVHKLWEKGEPARYE